MIADGLRAAAARGRAAGGRGRGRALVVRAARAHPSRCAGARARAGRVRARARRASAARPHGRRDPARLRARRARHPDDPLRLRAQRLERPLARTSGSWPTTSRRASRPSARCFGASPRSRDAHPADVRVPARGAARRGRPRALPALRRRSTRSPTTRRRPTRAGREQLDLSRLLVGGAPRDRARRRRADRARLRLRDASPGTVADAPVVGLIAHVDTSPEAPGAGVTPIVHRAWAGERSSCPGDPVAGARPGGVCRSSRGASGTTS